MAATKRLRPVGHEDRLSLVEHLSELRHRLMICAVVLGVAFGFSLWQQSNLLHLLNKPLEGTTQKSDGALAQNATFQKQVGIALESTTASLNALAATEKPSPERARLQLSIK